MSEGSEQEKAESTRVELQHDGVVAVLRLNRPEKLNALTVEMLHTVAASIRTAAAGSDVDALVLTGAGRAFSAGDDLEESRDLDAASFRVLLQAFQDVTRALTECTKPVVAAVNGIAVGGAAEITLGCDVRVGGPDTEYFFPENGIGLTISNASSLLLPALVGRRALGLVLLERRISAVEAAGLGLLDRVVGDTAEVLPAALEVARRLAGAGKGTPYHLALLRRPAEEVERALQRELEVGCAAFETGVVAAGLDRFWQQREG
jgi:enoyl-CoA hydratase/carnithine racemase